jgi:predicted DNA-binding transcriptional regulator YafY
VLRGKQESTNALKRQWALVRKIPRQPLRKTAGQLTSELASEGFAVQKRTVERDLIALSEVFPAIECDERDRPFGWSWARDAVSVQLPGMTASQALVFQMVAQFLKPLLPGSTYESLQPFFAAAREKLGDLSPLSSWQDKVRVVHPAQTLIPPNVNAAVHRAVTEGLLVNRQMEIVYRKRGKPDTVTHVVNPLGLVQRGPVAYFVVNQSKDPFYLAMHRISRASLLEAPAQPPSSFDLDRLIASGGLGFGNGKPIRLNAVFRDPAAEHLQESPLSADQTLVRLHDGKTRVTATVPHTQQLEWWLMAFGDQVEVKGPAPLRRRFATVARATSRQYSMRSAS